MEDAQQLANLNALARRLRVPATWLRIEADAGRLPCIRAGSQRLFNVAVVERLLAERAAGSERKRPRRVPHDVPSEQLPVEAVAEVEP